MTRRYAYMVAGVQLGAGINGLALLSRFRTKPYEPAYRLGNLLVPGNPALWWSCLLVVLSVAAIVSVYFRNDRFTRHFFAALFAWWIFWAFLYAVSILDGGGPWGMWLALMSVVGNSRPVIAPSLSD